MSGFGSSVFPPRVAAILESGCTLADAVPGVLAVGLAGSWARGAARPDSDVDLIVLSDQPDALLHDQGWYPVFDPAAELIRADDFGAIQERRLKLSDGTVVEVGVGRQDWARTEPVDPGTRRVVEDGLVALVDAHGLLETLQRAIRLVRPDPITQLPDHDR